MTQALTSDRLLLCQIGFRRKEPAYRIGRDLRLRPLLHPGFRRQRLQQAVMTQAATATACCSARSDSTARSKLDWRVVFVPTQGMQEAMQRSLHAAP